MGSTRRTLIALAVFCLLVVSVPHDEESLVVRESRGLATAELQVKALMDAVQSYMIENNRRVPTWQDLLTADERGHKWIERDSPCVDPWGNAYVIATDPDFDHGPVVQSAGPDGMPGTADDITNKTITGDKRRPRGRMK